MPYASISELPDAVRELLKKYSVTHIIWGPSEQRTYPAANLATLESVATRVHDADGWTIFQVTQ